MKHFSIDDWVDFARLLSSTEQRASMQQHLDAGCTQCSKTLDLWRHVVNFAIRERSYEPPLWAVRAVNASFAVSKLIAPASKLEIAKLLFDSALQPVTAGVRGTAAVARQLLYRSGSVCIDMRMQAKPGSDSVVLIGQLLDSAKPDHGISGVPVTLLSNGETMLRRKTNEVGEFDLGIAAMSQMQLVFGISKGKTIVVPVPDSEGYEHVQA